MFGLTVYGLAVCAFALMLVVELVRRVCSLESRYTSQRHKSMRRIEIEGWIESNAFHIMVGIAAFAIGLVIVGAAYNQPPVLFR